MKKYYILFILCLLLSPVARAQNKNLPASLTPEEAQQMSAYLANIAAQKGITTPPPAPVRTPAEWEEGEALCITWTSYTDILTQIVQYAVNEMDVYIICSNPSTVQTQLTNAGISLANVHFLQEPFNSIWIRDYGPWSVYANDVGTPYIVDWIYNRPRPDDDVLPDAIAAYANIPIYSMTAAPYDLTDTGGNFQTDGCGTAFSSKLILDENPTKTEAQIDNIKNLYMGIDRYIKMDVLPYDGIHHIDMHMAMLDEETILFGEYPAGISDGPQIEANIDYIQNNFTTAFGNPYRIVRVPMPPDASGQYPNAGGDYRTYTNSIFLNKTILVPIYNHASDADALATYQAELPGYNVVGINCNNIISASGALHCITKVVHSNDPLRIATARLYNTCETTARTVQAIIQHESGISSANVYYKTTAGGTYTAIPMTLVDAAEARWEAQIPAQSAGTSVYYYIEATAVSGKTQVRPITAPTGYFKYTIENVSGVPVVDFSQSATSVCPGTTVQFNEITSCGTTAWNWTFTGGTPATSTLPNPVVTYSSSGTFSASLTATNANGSSTKTVGTAVSVLSGVEPFSDDFTANTNNWSISNPSGTITWAWKGNITCGSGTIALNNFDYNSSGANDYFSATLDLSGYQDAQLQFDVAYAGYNTTYCDRLKVNVIPCAGSVQTLYDKSCATLNTAANTTSAFSPNACSQWRTETINLSAFDGQLVTIQFQNINGYGNWIYIDDIVISGTPVSCENDLTLNAAIAGNEEHLAAQSITATNSIAAGAMVTYSAGQWIDLKDGFTAVSGCDFHAYIGGCTPKSDNNATVTMEKVNENTALRLALSPNPLQGNRLWLHLINQVADMEQVQIDLIDVKGQTVRRLPQQLLPLGNTLLSFDEINLPSGLYICRVLQQGGVMQTAKVIVP